MTTRKRALIISASLILSTAAFLFLIVLTMPRLEPQDGPPQTAYYIPAQEEPIEDSRSYPYLDDPERLCPCCDENGISDRWFHQLDPLVQDYLRQNPHPGIIIDVRALRFIGDAVQIEILGQNGILTISYDKSRIVDALFKPADLSPDPDQPIPDGHPCIEQFEYITVTDDRLKGDTIAEVEQIIGKEGTTILETAHTRVLSWRRNYAYLSVQFERDECGRMIAVSKSQYGLKHCRGFPRD
jgi:hypothetical protein